MKIERSLFLALTTAIAGLACGADPAPEPRTARAEPMPSASTSATDNTLTIPASTAPEAGAPALASATATATASSARPPPPPLPRVAASVPCRPTTKTFDPAKQNCNDGAAAAINCSAAPGFPSTETCRGKAYAKYRCEYYVKTLKPKIAQAAFACMRKNTGPDSCDICTTDICGWEALMGACLDPEAEPTCKQISSTCSGVDQGECMSLLSGVNVSSRTKVVDCLANNCRWGIMGCIGRVNEG